MDAFAVSNLVEFFGSEQEITERAGEYGSAACHEPDRVLVCEFAPGAYITKMTFGLNVAKGLGVTDERIRDDARTHLPPLRSSSSQPTRRAQI